MKTVAGLITWIKALSIPAKVATGAVSVAVIGGGITTAIVSVNQNNEKSIEITHQIKESQPQEDLSEQETADEHDDEKNDESEKGESEENKTATATNTTSSKQSSNTSSSSNSSTQSSTTQQQTQTSQSGQSTSTKRADYNLNTPYYLSVWAHRGYYNKCWQTIGDAPTNDSEIGAWADRFYTPECQGQEASPVIWGIGKSIAEAGKAVEQKAASQYAHYFFALKAYEYEGELTETYCQKYGLSCDRW